jgi:diaminopimelate decarboxylase
MNVSRPGLERLCGNVVDIASATGTPFFSYDWPSLAEVVGLLKSRSAAELTQERQFYLALFAMPNLRLFAKLLSLDDVLGVSCNTPEEVQGLKNDGWNQWNRVVFSGGVLPKRDLELVAETGCLIHAASADNFKKLLEDGRARLPMH